LRMFETAKIEIKPFALEKQVKKDSATNDDKLTMKTVIAAVVVTLCIFAAVCYFWPSNPAMSPTISQSIDLPALACTERMRQDTRSITGLTKLYNEKKDWFNQYFNWRKYQRPYDAENDFLPCLLEDFQKETCTERYGDKLPSDCKADDVLNFKNAQASGSDYLQSLIKKAEEVRNPNDFVECVLARSGTSCKLTKEAKKNNKMTGICGLVYKNYELSHHVTGIIDITEFF